MPSDPCTINAIGTVARFLKGHPTTREIRLRIPGDVMSDLLPAVDVWDQSAGKVSFESFRLAWTLQYAVWALAVVGILITRHKTRKLLRLENDRILLEGLGELER